MFSFDAPRPRMPVVLSYPVVTAKTVSRHCQMFPGVHTSPQLRTTGLVAPALSNTDTRTFPSPQNILLDSLVYRSSSYWHLYSQNFIPARSLGLNFFFVSYIKSANSVNKSYFINGVTVLPKELIFLRKGFVCLWVG